MASYPYSKIWVCKVPIVVLQKGSNIFKAFANYPVGFVLRLHALRMCGLKKMSQAHKELIASVPCPYWAMDLHVKFWYTLMLP